MRVSTGDMYSLDRVTADVDDNLYVVVAGSSRIVRLGSGGTTEVVAGAAGGLSIPTSA